MRSGYRSIPSTVIATLALAACADLSPSRALPSLPPIDGDGARSALVLVDSAAGHATVAVLVESRDASLGAYQGTVTYDPTGLQLERVVVPDDGTRLSNAEHPGVVRVAGFDAEGLRGHEAARLEFRVIDWTRLRDAVVTLDVAGTRDGVRVAPERLRAVAGIHALPR